MATKKMALGIMILIFSMESCYAKMTSIKAISKHTLAITLSSASINKAQQQPFFFGKHDVVKLNNGRHRWLYRNNRLIGTLVGMQEGILYPFDSITSSDLDERHLDQANSYILSSTDDPAYRNAAPAVAVSRKSKPSDMAYTGKWTFEFPIHHTVYATFSKPLSHNKSYRLDLSSLNLGFHTYRHQPNDSISDAIHINQVGFSPNDSVKHGYFSLWQGQPAEQCRFLRCSQGNKTPKTASPPHNTFFLRTPSHRQVFSGSLDKVTLNSQQQHRLTKSPVWKMDFSQFNQPGQYQLCISDHGCSHYFKISTDVWKENFQTSVKGLFNQRSGMALKHPYSAFQRPRNLHPADGFDVIQSNERLLDSKNGLNFRTGTTNFDRLSTTLSSEPIDYAWGGYADAGDWDRRVQHLRVSRLLFELIQLYPTKFAHLDLNIPESHNDLPDIVDEALWGLEFYRRLQRSDGAVPGGIESQEHPRHGEASWQESQKLFLYAPDLWSSYLYSAAAAKAANWLKKSHPKRSKKYRISAIKAMTWAEKQRLPIKRNKHSKDFAVIDARNLAASELFALTQHEHWHTIFKSTTVFKTEGLPIVSHNKYDQSDAAFTYSNSRNKDSALSNNIVSAFTVTANIIAQSTLNTPFGWAMNNPREWLGWGALSVPQAINLARAYTLTNNNYYWQSTLRASQFGLGANPSNLSFTTGVGYRYPQNPLHHDHHVSAQAVPHGLTLNGPHDATKLTEHWLMPMLDKALYPNYQEWPLTENYLDIFSFAPMTEFSTHNTIGINAYVWGFLYAKG